MTLECGFQKTLSLYLTLIKIKIVKNIKGSKGMGDSQPGF